MRLGVFYPGFDGNNPALSLGSIHALEDMPVPVQNETEVGRASFYDVAGMSLHGSFQSPFHSRMTLVRTHQVENSLGMIFVFRALGEEEQAFTGLSGMGCIGVSDVLILLSIHIVCKMAMLQRLIAEPEVFFGEEKTPNRNVSLENFKVLKNNGEVLLETRGLIVQDTLIDGVRLNLDLVLAHLLLLGHIGEVWPRWRGGSGAIRDALNWCGLINCGSIGRHGGLSGWYRSLLDGLLRFARHDVGELFVSDKEPAMENGE